MKRINKSIKLGLSAICGEAREWAIDKQIEFDNGPTEFTDKQMNGIWEALIWIEERSEGK